MVPQLHAVLLDEVRIPGRLLDDRSYGVLVVRDAERRGRADERGARRRGGEPAQLAIGEQAVVSPISTSRSVRSCSGSPESATPVAASTSSLIWMPEGTARLNAFTTLSARSTRAPIRCLRLASRSRRAASRANVTRNSGCEPTSCTSVVAQAASVARTSNSISSTVLPTPRSPE